MALVASNGRWSASKAIDAAMKVHFYINEAKERTRAAGDALKVIAQQSGIEVVAASVADVLVAIGGDGTLLRAVREFPGIPVLGFNLGGLGYLANIEEKDFEKAMEALVRGDYRVSNRTALAVRKVGTEEWGFALNDVVIMREMSGQAALLDLSIDGHSATHYFADGLVIATPTGSTAYSLSAGGPVLMPDSASFVVTPMNPHALGVRPMVVSDDVKFIVTSRRRETGEAEKIGVYADGCVAFMLDGDESLEIRKSELAVRMLELVGHDPYEVLARKLGWSGARVKLAGARED
jgi:NAD+ kinase